MKADEGKVAVWWLRSEDADQLTGRLTGVDLLARLGVIPYIAEEVRNCSGRAGRGRLWVASDIPVRSIDWPRSDHVNAARAEESAGIVIWIMDVNSLWGLPGLVTDANLDTLLPSGGNS